MQIPQTEDPPLIRTDFSDDARWAALVEAAQAEYEDGFVANIAIVDDRQFEGRDPGEIALAAANATDHAVALVADAAAMEATDPTILCLDLLSIGNTVRIVPSELWGIENNLSLANMDFADFADAADEDGVFRGF